MFDPKQAVWQRDMCHVSEHIHIRVWRSQGQKNTWQIFLLWQDEPSKPRTKIYSRYIMADNVRNARQGAYAVIKRWLIKQSAPHPALHKKTWNMILQEFGLPILR